MDYTLRYNIENQEVKREVECILVNRKTPNEAISYSYWNLSNMQASLKNFVGKDREEIEERIEFYKEVIKELKKIEVKIKQDLYKGIKDNLIMGVIFILIVLGSLSILGVALCIINALIKN